MAEDTIASPASPGGGIRGVVKGIGRALLEVFVFATAGPITVALLMLVLAWIEPRQLIITPGGTETARALAEFSILYLPVPFILAGTLYAVAARVIAPLLIIALGSGLITFASLGSGGTSGRAVGLSSDPQVCSWAWPSP